MKKCRKSARLARSEMRAGIMLMQYHNTVSK